MSRTLVSPTTGSTTLSSSLLHAVKWLRLKVTANMVTRRAVSAGYHLSGWHRRGKERLGKSEGMVPEGRETGRYARPGPTSVPSGVRQIERAMIIGAKPVNEGMIAFAITPIGYKVK